MSIPLNHSETMFRTHPESILHHLPMNSSLNHWISAPNNWVSEKKVVVSFQLPHYFDIFDGSLGDFHGIPHFQTMISPWNSHGKPPFPSSSCPGLGGQRLRCRDHDLGAEAAICLSLSLSLCEFYIYIIYIYNLYNIYIIYNIHICICILYSILCNYVLHMFLLPKRDWCVCGIPASPGASWLRPGWMRSPLPVSGSPSVWSRAGTWTCQWIGLRDNLQETMVFTIQYGIIWGFPVNFPLNQLQKIVILQTLEVSPEFPRDLSWPIQ